MDAVKVILSPGLHHYQKWCRPGNEALRTYIPLGLVECCEQDKQLLGVPVKEMGKISGVN